MQAAESPLLLKPLDRSRVASAARRRRHRPGPIGPHVSPLGNRPAEHALFLLCQALYDEFVVPPLRDSATGREYLARVEAFWPRLYQAHEAIWTLSEQVELGVGGALPDRAEEALSEQMRAALPSIVGETGVGEFDFCLETMQRSDRLMDRVALMKEAADLARDTEILETLWASLALFAHARASLLAVCVGTSVRSPEVVDVVFTLLRAGALDAYASARAAIELRQPAPPPDVATASPEDDRAFNRDLAEEYLDDARDALDRASGG